MKRILSCDFSTLELRVLGTLHKSGVVITYDGEMSLRTLHNILGMRSMGITVTVVELSDTVQGWWPKKVIIDDMHTQAYDIRQKIYVEDPPLLPVKRSGYNYNKVPRTKGERHANRRYRWG